MEVKNKELKKLFDVVELYFDMLSLPSMLTSFMACDDAIEDEIAALKAELTDAKRGRTIFRYDADNLRVEVLEKSDELRKANNQIDELKEKLNNERKHGEDLADVNGKLASENADLKEKVTLLETSRITWRSRAKYAEKRVMDLNEKIEVLEKEINDLKKKIHELEEENANLRVPPRDISKRPWHGDGNATTGARTCCESLSETIEFQSKKIKELEAEKTRLKEAYDIHETTIERLKLLLDKENIDKEDLSYVHALKFGDKVFVPWSDGPYMYIKPGELYNPRTKSCAYVGKTQHLKWFGERFEIK